MRLNLESVAGGILFPCCDSWRLIRIARKDMQPTARQGERCRLIRGCTHYAAFDSL